MEIVETSVYTEDIIKLLSDEEYQELQRFLVEHPTFGDLIQGSKGLRKLRWKLKSKTEDLTLKQIEILRKTFLGD